MRAFINMLKKDENAFSIGRVCALIGFFLWVGVTVFLVALGRTWGHYDTLTMGVFSFLLVQLCNKVLESRLFSVKAGVENATGNPGKQKQADSLCNGSGI